MNQSELPYPPLLFPGKREGVGTTLTNAPFQSLANIVAEIYEGLYLLGLSGTLEKGSGKASM